MGLRSDDRQESRRIHLQLDWKICVRVGVSVVLVYLAIHYWTTLTDILAIALGAAFPLLLGGAIAYVANILMCFYERLFFPKSQKKVVRKMRRVIDREYPEADVRCILVLDATTGQNGLSQARAFKEVCEIGGIVLTKLDGTAKGGIALAIRQELAVPVWYIGVGEGIDDLQPFDAKEFIEALF